MRTHLLSSFAAVAIAFAATSCGSDNTSPSESLYAVSASVESLSFDASGDSKSFTVTALSDWDAVTSDDWIKLTKSGTTSQNGTVEVTVGANSSKNERTGTVTLKSGTARTNISIQQDGREPEPFDPTIKVPEGYELVWHDEFDGTSLNTADWTYEIQGPGWVNNELQTYTRNSRVVELSDGILSINCYKESGKVYSARIYAHVGSGWKYGIFEARIRLPKGRGTWPAYWMMPVTVDWVNEGWPLCGEIDIMEEVGYNANYTSSSIHCKDYNHVMGTQKTAERYTAGAQDDFHIYRLEWTKDYIRTYVDDKLLLSFANDGKGKVSSWPFDKPFYPILNLAWGGDWGGAQGVDESCLPATMQVDYLRVFQQTQN